MKAALWVEHLTRKFGDFVAVSDLSFTLREGEILALLGPNGAGKTTTIRMICGLLAPTAGRIEVAGVNPMRDPARARRFIGYMPQAIRLYRDLRVEEILDIFGGFFGLPGDLLRERKRALYRTLELEQWRSVLVSALPAGIRQRVGLATALLHDPPILLLDEPTSGVDPEARRRFWLLLQKLREEGRSILVTTHYLEEARNCDRILLMDRGEKVAEGPPDALVRQAPFRCYRLHVPDLPRALTLLRTQVLALPRGRAVDVLVRSDEELRRILELLGEEPKVRAEPVPLDLEHLFTALVRARGPSDERRPPEDAVL